MSSAGMEKSVLRNGLLSSILTYFTQVFEGLEVCAETLREQHINKAEIA